MKLAFSSTLRELTSSTIVVDDADRFGRALSLDHHIGQTTDATLLSDVSTGIVINALRGGLDPNDYRHAVIRHMDADGVLSVWALQNPSRALDEAELLLTAARFGDFLEGDLDGLDASRALAIMAATQYASDIRSDARAFGNGLDRVDAILLDPGAVDVYQPQIDAWRRGADEARSAEVAYERGKHLLILRVPAGVTLDPVVLSTTFPHAIVGTESAGHFKLYLRPRYSWKYCEKAVGRVPLRDLAPGLFALRRAERRSPSAAYWSGIRFDDAVWAVETRRAPSLLTTVEVGDVAAALLDRIRCAEIG